MRIRASVNPAAVRLAAAFLAAIAVSAGAADDDILTLRVTDTKAEPGGIAAVVVRTYSPRGLEQGEICLAVGGGADHATLVGALIGHKITAKASSAPLATLAAVDVDSAEGDAVSDAAFDADSQTAMLRFWSPTGTVNDGDGPLAVFYFRLNDDLQDDQRFLIEIDPAGTYVIDADGKPVEVELKPGRLEVEVFDD